MLGLQFRKKAGVGDTNQDVVSIFKIMRMDR